MDPDEDHAVSLARAILNADLNQTTRKRDRDEYEGFDLNDANDTEIQAFQSIVNDVVLGASTEAYNQEASLSLGEENGSHIVVETQVEPDGTVVEGEGEDPTGVEAEVDIEAVELNESAADGGSGPIEGEKPEEEVVMDDERHDRQDEHVVDEDQDGVMDVGGPGGEEDASKRLEPIVPEEQEEDEEDEEDEMDLGMEDDGEDYYQDSAAVEEATAAAAAEAAAYAIQLEAQQQHHHHQESQNLSNDLPVELEPDLLASLETSFPESLQTEPLPSIITALINQQNALVNTINMLQSRVSALEANALSNPHDPNDPHHHQDHHHHQDELHPNADLDNQHGHHDISLNPGQDVIDAYHSHNQQVAQQHLEQQLQQQQQQQHHSQHQQDVDDYPADTEIAGVGAPGSGGRKLKGYNAQTGYRLQKKRNPALSNAIANSIAYLCGFERPKGAGVGAIIKTPSPGPSGPSMTPLGPAISKRVVVLPDPIEDINEWPDRPDPQEGEPLKLERPDWLDRHAKKSETQGFLARIMEHVITTNQLGSGSPLNLADYDRKTIETAVLGAFQNHNENYKAQIDPQRLAKKNEKTEKRKLHSRIKTRGDKRRLGFEKLDLAQDPIARDLRKGMTKDYISEEHSSEGENSGIMPGEWQRLAESAGAKGKGVSKALEIRTPAWKSRELRYIDWSADSSADKATAFSTARFTITPLREDIFPPKETPLWMVDPGWRERHPEAEHLLTADPPGWPGIGVPDDWHPQDFYSSIAHSIPE